MSKYAILYCWNELPTTPSTREGVTAFFHNSSTPTTPKEATMARNFEDNPISLMGDSSGRLRVKYFFQGMDFPPGIPTRPDRIQGFRTVQGRRQDTGVPAINLDSVGAELLYVGIANADDHRFKMVDISHWTQPITDQRMCKKLGVDTQTVVEVIYESDPPEDRIFLATRVIQNALRLLARQYSWNTTVWVNEGAALTINCRSPSYEKPKHQLVVRDGCLRVADVEYVDDNNVKKAV